MRKKLSDRKKERDRENNVIFQKIHCILQILITLSDKQDGMVHPLDNFCGSVFWVSFFLKHSFFH